MDSISNDLIKAAAFFVNSTSSHIFLTGKAGTGKTTFLKNLALNTHKKFVIVAPTGIAALNAGGVTIHSQFQLPLGTFLPDKTPSGNFSSDNNVYTQYTLVRKHPINSVRKQVLRSIDLLIIDEVSMLRADVLDAIDYRMRMVRGNFGQSFGGVQVLLIGDLYQLPPIVKDHEWTYLKRYYHSAHFFEAKALQTEGYVFIELDKIFRQSDNRFIEILNNLRNNVTTKEDVEELNRHFVSGKDAELEENVITITTHNYKAEEINKGALYKLPGKQRTYKAIIENEFPESIYPLPENLELKVGAQIMFVKNDTSGNGKYFNGKLARVVILDDEDIFVELDGTKERLKLEKEMWENKKYTVNSASKELDEDVIGSFTQYPVKLAWAVTVHKSQGLTFEKAMIDVGHAFAPGQVYVALSRLKSLDGLRLRTRIDPSVITSDSLVVAFSDRKNLQKELTVLLKEKQSVYLRELIQATFDFRIVVKELEKFFKDHQDSDEFEDETMKSTMSNILSDFRNEDQNTAKFRHQLLHLLSENDREGLSERLAKGSAYYATMLKNNIQKLLVHAEQVKKFSRQKTYLNSLGDIDQFLTKKLEEMDKSVLLVGAIMNQEEEVLTKSTHTSREADRLRWIEEARAAASTKEVVASNKTGKVRKPKPAAGTKKMKGDSAAASLALFLTGMTIEKIAEERSLTPGTIENHLFQCASEGTIDYRQLITEAEETEIRAAYNGYTEEGMKPMFDSFQGKYSYHKLKAVKELMGKDLVKG